jgi:hypothetical protein
VAAGLFHADMKKIIAALHNYLVKAPEMGLKEIWCLPAEVQQLLDFSAPTVCMCFP